MLKVAVAERRLAFGFIGYCAIGIIGFMFFPCQMVRHPA